MIYIDTGVIYKGISVIARPVLSGIQFEKKAKHA